MWQEEQEQIFEFEENWPWNLDDGSVYDLVIYCNKNKNKMTALQQQRD